MSTGNPTPGNPPAAEPAERAQRKVMQGTVTSTKMQKTVVVQIDRKVKHPLYEKFVSQRTKLYAHDENNETKVGDVVALRPTSKMAPRVDDNAGAGRGQVPQWLDVDTAGRKGTVRGLPLREDIQIPVSEQLIVELYSK